MVRRRVLAVGAALLVGGMAAIGWVFDWEGGVFLRWWDVFWAGVVSMAAGALLVIVAWPRRSSGDD